MIKIQLAAHRPPRPAWPGLAWPGSWKSPPGSPQSIEPCRFLPVMLGAGSTSGQFLSGPVDLHVTYLEVVTSRYETHSHTSSLT